MNFFYWSYQDKCFTDIAGFIEVLDAPLAQCVVRQREREWVCVCVCVCVCERERHSNNQNSLLLFQLNGIGYVRLGETAVFYSFFKGAFTCVGCCGSLRSLKINRLAITWITYNTQSRNGNKLTTSYLDCLSNKFLIK